MVGVAAGLLVGAVLLRRADLVVLAAPLVLGAVLGLARRPRALPELQLSVPPAVLLEGEAVSATVRLRSAEPLDVAAVELLTPPFLRREPGHAGLARATTLPAGGDRELVFALRSWRWGRRVVGPAVLQASAGYGLLRFGPYQSDAQPVTTWPLREGFTATEAVPWAEGLVGLHRSRRPGEGSDVAGVRRYQPGDRLRRVNWPVTQRTGQLHVTATYSDRDTEVLACLDSRYDLGTPPASCLDVGVRATAAVAEHYLRNGDRVALADLGRPSWRVPAATGRAQLARILAALLDVRPAGRADRSEHTARWLVHDLPTIVPVGGLVVVLSPLAGATVFEVTAALARSGRAVVVVDTLPVDARPARTGPWTELAFRLWRLDRERDLARLGELGVPVVPWLGAGSLDQVLRDVSRVARAPRVSR